jgi:diguanylate cyclase (GGDEF)-like protein
MKVLIADDEPASRLLLAATLERLGHSCVQAEDGEEAWRLFGEQAPEVVVTEWQMPGLDGTQLVARLRAAPGVAYTYVLVLTGAADAETARGAMEAGADDVLLEPLDEADLERKLIAAERVTALHRRLHADARHDPLTGIGNRLRLAEDLEAVCGRVERYGHNYCVAIVDVDRFKAYNDASGHRAGDDVLRAVAASLRDTVRTGDAVYRYGGEEFAVLLPEQTLDGAARAGERLRAAVEELGLERPEGGSVTVSVGVAGLGDARCSPDQLFELADEALNQAKAAGRNRVQVRELEGGEEERRIRVMVAGDDPGVRLTLGALVGADGGLELVGDAGDAGEAIALAARRRPDVVVLDFDMPGGAGLRAAIEIREACPTARIVALSADATPAAQLDMSRAGAVGYLVKGASGEEIARTIRSSARW